MTILGTATTATTAETEGAFQGKFKATVALTAPLTDGQSIAAKVVKAGFVVANTLAAVAAAASLSQLRVWRLDNPDNANPVTVRVAMADFDPAVTDYRRSRRRGGVQKRGLYTVCQRGTIVRCKLRCRFGRIFDYGRDHNQIL